MQYIRILRLLLGTAVVAFGIMLTLKAELGYAPWEVFHSGLSHITHISIGKISIITSFVIVMLSYFIGIKPGLGTIVSMVFVGLMLDLFMLINLEIISHFYWLRIMVFIIGLFIMAIGVYLYVGAGFGAGPRDSIMVLFAQKTQLHSGVCKAIVDGVVVICGFFLGGKLGVGTLLSILVLGFAIKIVFTYLKFDITKVKHDSLFDSMQKVRLLISDKDDQNEIC